MMDSLRSDDEHRSDSEDLAGDAILTTEPKPRGTPNVGMMGVKEGDQTEISLVNSGPTRGTVAGNSVSGDLVAGNAVSENLIVGGLVSGISCVGRSLSDDPIAKEMNTDLFVGNRTIRGAATVAAMNKGTDDEILRSQDLKITIVGSPSLVAHNLRGRNPDVGTIRSPVSGKTRCHNPDVGTIRSPVSGKPRCHNPDVGTIRSPVSGKLRCHNPDVGTIRSPVSGKPRCNNPDVKIVRSPVTGIMRDNYLDVGIFRDPVGRDLRGPLVGNMRGKQPEVGIFQDPVAWDLRDPLAGNVRGGHAEVGIFRDPVAGDLRGPLAGNMRGIHPEVEIFRDPVAGDLWGPLAGNMRGKHTKVRVFWDPVAEYLRGPLAGNMRGKHPEVGIFREPVAEDIRDPLSGNVLDSEGAGAPRCIDNNRDIPVHDAPGHHGMSTKVVHPAVVSRPSLLRSSNPAINAHDDVRGDFRNPNADVRSKFPPPPPLQRRGQRGKPIEPREVSQNFGSQHMTHAGDDYFGGISDPRGTQGMLMRSEQSD